MRFFMVFGLIYMFYGFFRNFKKEEYQIRTLNTAGFALFLGLFALGALKKYPFTVPRTSLFFCPIVFYMVVKGIAGLKSINKFAYAIVHGLYILFLLFLTVQLSRLVFTHQTLFGNVL